MLLRLFMSIESVWSKYYIMVYHYTSHTDSASSDTTLVASNWSLWEYLYHRKSQALEIRAFF